MAEGIYKITEQFEQALCDYTGAKYAVSVDNQSNALFLALMYENVKDEEISIPCRTYPSVPCEIIHAGARIKWLPVEGETIKGAYQLAPTRVWDSALRFTALEHTCVLASLVLTNILNYLKEEPSLQMMSRLTSGSSVLASLEETNAPIMKMNLIC